MNKNKTTFWSRNSLSIVLLTLMIIFWGGQFFTGWLDHNDERKDEGLPALTVGQYATSGHFVSATFENWESEFLQMGIYVLLTISLRQKGSSESKKLKGEEGPEDEEIDKEPQPKVDAPWPVKKGGIWLKLYSNSLSICFIILFLVCFWLHFAGSLIESNEERSAKGKAVQTAGEYITSSQFWFESFQNWQSEFLAVAAIVILSIWLRQKGSPESKPVDASHSETGK